MDAILRHSHPDMHIAWTRSENKSPLAFWSLADRYPELLIGLHKRARFMGAFDLNGSVPWPKKY